MARRTLIILSAALGLFLVLVGGYAGWNHADPERTCASCHEIIPSMESWQTSAHREVSCVDCHGTAMGNGWHSLKEKSRMVFSHLRRGDDPPHPGLEEEGVFQVMEACTECHRDEHRSWMAGGHSARYADIFLNQAHNRMERPYPDCFRCHGMYYGGKISDLVEPISTTGPWTLKEGGKEEQHVIPCLACHPIHKENEPLFHPGTMDDPKATFYQREKRAPSTGLYLRSDRMHLRSDQLPKPDIFENGRVVMVSDDPVQRLCMHCHSPNWAHEAGTEDDKTPTGVHEGISCRACHRDHSNNPMESCLTCHPAVTSCSVDVMEMNTTFRNRNSPNDIHHMKCTDCHDPVPVSAL